MSGQADGQLRKEVHEQFKITFKAKGENESNNDKYSTY